MARLVEAVASADDCFKLVLPYHAVKHAADGTDPCDPPGWGYFKAIYLQNIREMFEYIHLKL